MNKINVLTGMALLLLAVGCKDNDMEYDASGVFETTEVVVSAQTSGEIRAFSVREGDSIVAGRTFGVIDTTQLVLQKKQLLATISATDSRRLDESRQMASLRQQLENLRREKQRFEGLLAQKAATRKQVDDIGYQISVVEKQIAAQREQIGTANQSLSGQKGSIVAQIQQLEEQIKHSYISSPIAGVVLEKYMEQGEFALPGKPLFKVSDLGTVYLRAYITAPQLTEVRLGQPCTVYADSGASERKAYNGRITWIASEAEFTPKTIQTRDERANLVYAVKIAVSNDGFIKRGMYGEVKF